MRKIVITGGAGFIGSHLVEQLLEDSDNLVRVIDDFSVGKPTNLPKNKRLIVNQLSVLDASFADNNFFDNVDIVYHLAALTRPRWSIEYPEETNKANVDGTLRVLSACLAGKVAKFIYVSSASAYGEQKSLLLKETMKLNPMSPYALTKQIGEEYCELYSKLYGLKYDVIRPFNVYGPRQSLQGAYSAAVSNFIDMLQNSTIPYITGTGKQVRDFVYVKDVVRLMVILGKRKGSGEVFNAGSGKSTSINELYKLVSKLMNKNIKPEYRDPVTDPETKADIKKARMLLKWEPKYNLKNGLLETIKETLK